ncbi:MAG: hypothetical protein MZU95_11650 [Desulfomicrobium escambiense]|nr:hypothetical protein [Desulfomicrobium escambiense]
MYAYVASKEASVAVDSITGGSQTMDYSAIPSIVFTNPEIASVGKAGESTALVKKGTFPVSALGQGTDHGGLRRILQPCIAAPKGRWSG